MKNEKTGIEFDHNAVYVIKVKKDRRVRQAGKDEIEVIPAGKTVKVKGNDAVQLIKMGDEIVDPSNEAVKK